MSLSCINEAHCILLSKLYYYYNYAHYLRLHLICQLMDWKESKAKLISEVFVAIHACITISKSHRRFWFVSILITLISNDHNSLFYPVTFSSAHCVKMNEKDTQTHTVAAEWPWVSRFQQGKDRSSVCRHQPVWQRGAKSAIFYTMSH